MQNDDEGPWEIQQMDIPVPFAAITELNIISHLTENQLSKLLPPGVTPAQFGVINHLARLKRTETIGQIASAQQVTQPTMSSTVKKLEQQGYVKLLNSQKDGRIREVQVTRLGDELRRQIVTALNPKFGHLIKELSKTEWIELHSLLSKLRNVLDNNR